MAILAQGDIWTVYEHTNHFIFTGNAVVKNNGALVMGAGMAKQVRDRYPGIDKEFGKAVLNNTDNQGRYGCLIGKHWGVFQVKTHFGNKADLDLIQHSAAMLYQHAKLI